MANANALIVLTNTLKQFRSVLENIPVCISSHGRLGSLDSENFQKFINENNDEISRTLLTSKIVELASSKPARDHKFIKLLEGDIYSYNVHTPRKLVSAITKESTGKSKVYNRF